MKKLVLFFTLSLALGACSPAKKAESAPAPEIPPPSEQDRGVGPFTVEFDPNSGMYHHSFKIRPKNADGKVEYFVTTPLNGNLQLTNTDLKLTGCPASQVSHQIIWFPNASNEQDGYYLRVGSLFTTVGGTQGKLMHIVRGLVNCTELEMSTDLLKLN